jgi:hypothetical protein
LGRELIHDISGFTEVRVADIIFGMSQQSGGWTGPSVEYPHYGLNVDGTNFALARRWLEDYAGLYYGWRGSLRRRLQHIACEISCRLSTPFARGMRR